VAGTVVSSEEKQGAMVLRIQGKLHLEELDPLRKRLQQVWRARPRRLVLEFSECPFVDSAGLAILVGAYKHACEANMGFFLVGVGEQFYNALQVTRLHEVFKIRDSVEAALAG